LRQKKKRIAALLSEIEDLKALKARAVRDVPVARAAGGALRGASMSSNPVLQRQTIPDMEQEAWLGSSRVEAGAQGGGEEVEEDSEIAKLIATETEVCVCVWGGDEHVAGVGESTLIGGAALGAESGVATPPPRIPSVASHHGACPWWERMWPRP